MLLLFLSFTFFLRPVIKALRLREKNGWKKGTSRYLSNRICPSHGVCTVSNNIISGDGDNCQSRTCSLREELRNFAEVLLGIQSGKNDTGLTHFMTQCTWGLKKCGMKV
jgi:hypothetical protein